MTEYKCPYCGEWVPAEKWEIHLKACPVIGPGARARETPPPPIRTPEKVEETVKDLLYRKGEPISDSICIPRSEVIRLIVENFGVSGSEANKILDEILGKERGYPCLFQYFDLICHGYK